MRKTARKSGAKTIHNCLARADNASPFRWIGCWVAAVNGNNSYEKADRGVERSRTRRGSKKRGKGSTVRRLATRGFKAALAWAGRARQDEQSLIRKMEKASRAVAKIDKLSNRGIMYAFTCLSRMVETEGSLSEVREKLEGESIHSDRWYRLRQARDRLKAQLETQRRKAICMLSSVWGIPRDAAVKRMSNRSELFARAIPRVTLGEWSQTDTNSGAWARRQLSHQRVLITIPYQSESCQCKACRTSTLCDAGHNVDPYVRSCGFCGWVRPSCLRPFGSRPRGNGRRERNQPRRFCRRCGSALHDGECKSAPRRPTRANAKSRH
jgi:hypothetical protein